MKNLFKISAIILAITLIFSVVTVKAATTDVTYSADKTTVKPGDEITITIHATCDDGINCVGTDVDGTTTEVVFDENVLELVEITGKSGFSTLAPEGTNIITLMATGDKTDADVGEIVFKVKDGAVSGTTTVKIEGMLLSAMNSDATFEIPDKSISITIGATSGDGNNPVNPDDGNDGNNPANPDDGNDGNNPANPDDGNDGNNPVNPDDGNDGNNPANPDDGNGGNNPANPDDGNDGNNPANPDDGNDGANPNGGNDSSSSNGGNGSSKPNGGNDSSSSNGGNGSSNLNGSTTGEKDKTTTSTKLPDTGVETYVMVAVIAIIAVVSFVGYKKYSY